jgi:carboxypeptidase Q
MPSFPARTVALGFAVALGLAPGGAAAAGKNKAPGEEHASGTQAGLEPAALQAMAERLRTEERTSQGAYERLAWLCDRIGPRLSGSPQAAAAVGWAAATMRKDGLKDVRQEPVMVPHWIRGTEEITLVTPVTRRLEGLALGMSVSTPPEGITGEVVEVDSLDALQALGEKVRGRIVLFDQAIWRDPDGEGYGHISPLRHAGPSAAARQGAIGTLIRSLGTLDARLPHTGTLSYEEDAPKIPAAAISAEDALHLHRLLAAGETVRVRMLLDCRTLADAPSANVVGEWRGREQPDEIVLLGAHLDSWDVGAGAHDDGAGVVMVLEAIHLLKTLDLHPRRTLRAVLFMNEENGVRGGKGYAADHAAELPRHVAAIESDRGAGPPLGFSVAAGPGGADSVRGFAQGLAAIGAAAITEGGDGGVDISRMRAAGVPLLGLRSDMSGYFDWHHTRADTLDKIDRASLADGVVALAVMAYALAESDPPLPRLPPRP